MRTEPLLASSLQPRCLKIQREEREAGDLAHALIRENTRPRRITIEITIAARPLRNKPTSVPGVKSSPAPAPPRRLHWKTSNHSATGLAPYVTISQPKPSTMSTTLASIARKAAACDNVEATRASERGGRGGHETCPTAG